MKLKWDKWFYTLLQTVIGGVASSGSAWLGTLIGNQVDASIQPLDLKQFGLVLFTSTLLHLFFFLKASPLPAEATGNTDFIAKDPPSTLPLLFLLGALAVAAPLAFTGCAVFKAEPAKVAENVSDVSKVTVEAALRAWNDYIPVGKPSLEQQAQVREAWKKYKAAQIFLLDVAIVIKEAEATGKTDPLTEEALNGAILEASNALADLVKLLRSFNVKI